MKYSLIPLVFFLLVAFNLNGQHGVDSSRFTIGSAISIDSKYLDDSVLVYVHFPSMNEPQKEYPMILLLDAYSSFKSFSSSAELMAHEKTIPSCIVIGFPQRKYTDFTTNNLDSRMEKLARFIDQELFSYLEKRYTITKKIIWGQGEQSGLISSYFMLNYPDLFNGYISDIPNLSLLNKKEYSPEIFNNIQDKSLDYYIFGSSHLEGFNKEFLENLEKNAPEGLNWKYHTTDETNPIIHFLMNYMHALELFFN